MLPEQMLSGQMSPWQQESGQDCPRNLLLKFGQNQVNNSWDILDMYKCREDKCCLDKCYWVTLVPVFLVSSTNQEVESTESDQKYCKRNEKHSFESKQNFFFNWLLKLQMLQCFYCENWAGLSDSNILNKHAPNAILWFL